MSENQRRRASVRGELQVFELPSVELPTHVRRIRLNHNSPAAETVSAAPELIERNLDELGVRIG